MRSPAWLVPLLVIACAAGGVAGSRLLTAPSLTLTGTPAGPDAVPRTSVFVVSGVKCVDTAARAASQLVELPGLCELRAFAARARLEVTYDPALLGAAEIVAALEGPVLEPSTGEYLFGLYKVIEIDGRKIDSPNTL